MKKYLQYAISAIFGIILALPISINGATYRPPVSSIPENSIASSKIADETIVDADVSPGAAIDASKVDLAGLPNTDALAAGSVYSFIASSTDGTLSWQPSTNIIRSFFASSTDNPYIHQISVATSSKLVIWYGFHDLGCASGAGRTVGDFKVNASASGATTTIRTTEANSDNTNPSCAVQETHFHSATTSETVSISFENTSGNWDWAALTVLRLPF